MTKDTHLLIQVVARGMHYWEDAPSHRSYLAEPHAHDFLIIGKIPVSHDDRELEFHDLRDELNAVIQKEWPLASSDKERLYSDFEGMSCEMIARKLLELLPNYLEFYVAEDGVYGAMVTRGTPKPLSNEMLILTLCGSTKFKTEYGQAEMLLENLGISTFSVGGYMHADGLNTPEEQKKEYDRLHRDKISISHGIYVVNPGGYLGESTKSEILHADKLGKQIYALNPEIWTIEGRIIVGQDLATLSQDRLRVRDEIKVFTINMETKLLKNDYKGGWQNRDARDLYSRAELEMVELKNAIESGDKNKVIAECADVANFVMMITDILRKGGANATL